MDSSSSDLSEPPSSDPPSSPLSELSKSPSLSPPPRVAIARYLSPISSAPSGSASPMKNSDADSICVNPDGPPPPKRRKVERKPRTTEHLNLKAGYTDNQQDEELIERLKLSLRKKKKIVVIAGAGISVSAGIPDFRSSNGLFKTLRKDQKLKGSGQQLFDASVYKHDESTSSFHDMVRELAQKTKTAQPTPFHHMLATMAEEGRLLRLYSQNVDGIDTAMKPLATQIPLPEKGPWPKAVQLHGGLEQMICSKCNSTSPFDGSLFHGPEPPPCKACEEMDTIRTYHAGKRSHGIGKLRPRMVLYNEYNPDEEAIANIVKADTRARPDAVIVVGTSMKIPGVRQIVRNMCKVTRERKDGVAVWINMDPEPAGVELRDCWDIVVRGKCDDVANLVGLPHWDEPYGDDVKVDAQKYEKSIRSSQLEVRIPSPSLSASETVKSESRAITPVEAKPKSIEKVQGIPTPTASPKMRNALPTGKPAARTKQSRILFTEAKSAASGDAKPDVKGAKKPAPRKPRQPKKTAQKAAVPAATVKAAFKATKPATTVPSKLPAKRPAGSDKPKDSRPHDAGSEFTLRPATTRQKRADSEYDPKKAQDAVNSQLQQETNAHRSPPTTPTQSSRPGSAHSGVTISPPSKPRGMANLIE
ncbi:DHS-like NAD/FAD-binding domain-containing protein [Apiospora phragmitis]|uniref:DHS-like NAD/FAD-binding domain-containing protein n=1 Tax=Apiospora phragmitis TaxID=2905665 RepID=A0ABR1TSU5_9PEZI